MDKNMEYLKNSPVRQFLNQSQTKVFKGEEDILRDIDRIIDSNLNREGKKLNISVLGEVKAGKSTLVNALLREELSYVNVVEATAAIVKMSYGSGAARIFYKDGTSENFEFIEDLNKLMDDNLNNQVYFDSIKNIEIYSSNTILRKIDIVDTPGITTVTKENMERTYDYLAETDLIFWVLNIHHLGQRDVTDEIDKLMDLGKPIVCILNRIDELVGDLDGVLEYVDMEMGYMFEEIIPLSGKKAFDGHINKDDTLIDQSNIKALESYIDENIDNRVDELELEIVESSLNMQLKKDLELHKRIKNNLNSMLKSLGRDGQDLKDYSLKLKQTINDRLYFWVDNQLYNEEKNIVMSSIGTGEFKEKMNKYYCQEHLKEVILDKTKEMEDFVTSQWIIKKNSLIEKRAVENEEDLYVLDSSLLDFGEHDLKLSADLIYDSNVMANSSALKPSIFWAVVGGFISPILPVYFLAAGLGSFFQHNHRIGVLNRASYGKLEEINYSQKRFVKSNVVPSLKDHLCQYVDVNYNSIVDAANKAFESYDLDKESLEKLDREIVFYIENHPCYRDSLKVQ